MSEQTNEIASHALASALRIVLTVSISRNDASRLMSRLTGEEASELWSSTVYHWLAHHMLSSPVGWYWGSRALDTTLSEEMKHLSDLPPQQLANSLYNNQGAWNAEELAALLWTLVRRRDLFLSSLLTRMTQEVEIAILQFGAPPKTRSRRRQPRFLDAVQVS